MAYVVFDLDGTLADLVAVHKLLMALRHEATWSTDPSTEEQERNNVYTLFYKCVAAKETGPEPLGLFRPGIFDLLRKIKTLKQGKIVKNVIIYSNNSLRLCLEFARDVIHQVLGYNLFDELIHYTHPLRMLLPDGTPGASKTWAEMKKILMESKCKAPITLEPKEVIFFDDNYHVNLLVHMPLENYVKVAPYKHIRYTPVIEIFKSVLISSKIDWPQFCLYASKSAYDKIGTDMTSMINLLLVNRHGLLEYRETQQSEDNMFGTEFMTRKFNEFITAQKPLQSMCKRSRKPKNYSRY
jgi:hypothetical protein